MLPRHSRPNYSHWTLAPYRDSFNLSTAGSLRPGIRLPFFENQLFVTPFNWPDIEKVLQQRGDTPWTAK
jgi:hypothetical protein